VILVVVVGLVRVERRRLVRSVSLLMGKIK
jgi:hypothetical protein